MQTAAAVLPTRRWLAETGPARQVWKALGRGLEWQTGRIRALSSSSVRRRAGAVVLSGRRPELCDLVGDLACRVRRGVPFPFSLPDACDLARIDRPHVELRGCGLGPGVHLGVAPTAPGEEAELTITLSVSHGMRRGADRPSLSAGRRGACAPRARPSSAASGSERLLTVALGCCFCSVLGLRSTVPWALAIFRSGNLALGLASRRGGTYAGVPLGFAFAGVAACSGCRLLAGSTVSALPPSGRCSTRRRLRSVCGFALQALADSGARGSFAG